VIAICTVMKDPTLLFVLSGLSTQLGRHERLVGRCQMMLNCLNGRFCVLTTSTFHIYLDTGVLFNLRYSPRICRACFDIVVILVELKIDIAENYKF
jgi:hypothetical protein